MIKAIFFDLGKVLLDFEKNIIIERFREQSGLTDEDIKTAISIYRVADLERGVMPAREFHQQVNTALNLSMTYEEFTEIWSNIFTEIPEMIELFQSIRTKYQTYLASNTDPIHFPYVFIKYPWLKLFTGYALSYELKARKPEKEFFQHALAKFRLQPKECVYIDDIQENVVSARSIGISSVQYISPEQAINNLKELGIKV